ncbi:response regulator transcription factor [Pontibacter qinzhouensis]|uniref:Response regulator transcription factor n=1 Tax=Pontibacter qinzhouensis TaxID=2603253 RepID=A0A5C8KD79_9BACT|nr:response regulator transcription factor [Pontibacter qinzhouensis]TXK49832.1 response regulator transcription factor [Pontibacter qinzhouensis]
MINVIITDDHKIIRDGIIALLHNDPAITVVGEASNGKELIELLDSVTPDVVLLDINMPELDGFETTKYLKQHYPNVKVLVLSMLDHESYVNRVIELGASGYILKNSGKEELSAAIRLVSSGHIYISSTVALDLLKKIGNQNMFSSVTCPDTKDKKYKDISKRELEVLTLIGEGYTNAEIAERLFTSKRTIETHRQNLLEKTQTKNTATLIKYALQNNIIN